MGTLQKFAEGAFSTGAKLYADRAMTENKARLNAARDATLMKHREKLQGERITAQKEISEDRTTALLGSESNLLARDKRADREKLKNLTTQLENTTDVKKRTALIQEYDLISGRGIQQDTAWQVKWKGIQRANPELSEAEAMEKASRTSDSGLFNTVLKFMVDKQEDKRLKEGDPGWKTMQEMLDETAAAIAASRARRGAGGRKTLTDNQEKDIKRTLRAHPDKTRAEVIADAIQAGRPGW